MPEVASVNTGAVRWPDECAADRATLFNRTGKYHRLNWATTITDVAGHKLVDVVAGRDSANR